MITPSEPVVVDHGADFSFTITPNPGYEIEDIVVDLVSVGAVTEYLSQCNCTSYDQRVIYQNC